MDNSELTRLEDESVHLTVTSPPYVTTEFKRGQEFDYDGFLAHFANVCKQLYRVTVRGGQRRDLFNALYGTPPMFMFNREIWEKNRQRFVESYKTATPVARATGYSEMLSHRWLTANHAVQETRFANGVVVIVNFGDRPHTLPDGTVIEPLSHRVEGLESATSGGG